MGCLSAKEQTINIRVINTDSRDTLIAEYKSYCNDMLKQTKSRTTKTLDMTEILKRLNYVPKNREHLTQLKCEFNEYCCDQL